MSNGGWKTVVIDGKASIGYSEGWIIVRRDDEIKEIPVSEVKVLLIESLQVSISVYLLNELQKEKVKVIFCDATHNPVAEVLAYHDNYKQSGCISKQLLWSREVKDEYWSNIVKQKIENQITLLNRLNKPVSDELYKALDGVKSGDYTNREAVAAKIYFSTLFGNGFSRNKSIDINYGLNYGYSILLSMVNRKVTSCGYLTNLGIHHHSEENPYNLSCDIMEIFRPFIDEVTYQYRESPFNKEVKMAIIESFYREVKFRKKKTNLQTAVDSYVSSLLKNISLELAYTEEVVFYG